jgi:hypothetical protein
LGFASDSLRDIWGISGRSIEIGLAFDAAGTRRTHTFGLSVAAKLLDTRFAFLVAISLLETPAIGRG